MRDWNSKPQELPFAAAIKPRTLITLVQDGLAYDDLVASAKQVTKQYTFIKDKRRAVATTGISNAEGADPVTNSRKRARFGSKSAGSVTATADTTANVAGASDTSGLVGHVQDGVMNVDRRDSVNGADEVEVGEIEIEVVPEPEPLISTLEVGESKGMQSEYIQQHEDLKALHTVNLPGSDVVHLSWSTKDPKHLLATGGSAWRSWVVPQEQSTEGEQQELEFHDHGVGQEPFYVTATAWSPSANDLAIGLEENTELAEPNGEGGHLNHNTFTGALLLDQDSKVSRLTGTYGTTLSLRWKPDGSLLLWTTVQPNEKGTINLVNPHDRQHRQIYPTDKPGLDVVWVDENAFIVCGASHLDAYSIGDDQIAPKHSVTTSLTWEKLSIDAETNKAACMAADEGGYLGILNITEMNLEERSVHDERITSLEWQPLKKQSGDEDAMDTSDAAAPPPPRILATSSIDGTVKLWNARSGLECLQTFSMGPSESAMILSFSPDGRRVAAASHESVIIWKAEQNGKLLAKWTQESVSSLQAEQGDAMVVDKPEVVDEADQPIYTLSWNCDGSKLAYGQGQKVCRFLLPVFSGAIL